MLGRRPGQRIGPLQTHNRETALGEALERARVKAGLTFAELAAKSQVSRRTLLGIANPGGYVDDYGRGRRVHHRTIRKLDAALDCQLYELAKEIEAERAPKPRGRSKVQSSLERKLHHLRPPTVQRGSTLHRKRSLKVQSSSPRAVQSRSARRGSR